MVKISASCSPKSPTLSSSHSQPQSKIASLFFSENKRRLGDIFFPVHIVFGDAISFSPFLQNTNNSGSESDTSSVMELNEKLLEAHKKVFVYFLSRCTTNIIMMSMMMMVLLMMLNQVVQQKMNREVARTISNDVFDSKEQVMVMMVMMMII